MTHHFPTDRFLLWLLLSCAGTLLTVPAVIKIAPKIGALDDPSKDTRRIHREVIPRIGGLALSVIFTLIYLIQNYHDIQFGLIGGVIVLTILGIVDDTKGVAPKIKMSFHCLAAVMAVAVSGISFQEIPVPLIDIPPIRNHFLCTIFSVIFCMGVTNAINLIDGLDGLAAGIGSIASGGIVVLAALSDNTSLCLASTILLGSQLAILAFNSHPARIFLGDTGSMLIGYLLACFGMELVGSGLGSDSKVPYSVFLPILLMVVPCTDCLWVMLARMIRGRHPFRSDRTHVHHEVLDLGIHHKYVVLWLLSISLLITIACVCLRDKSNDVIFLFIVCLMQFVIGGIRFLAKSTAYRRIVVKISRIQRSYFSYFQDREPHEIDPVKMRFRRINKYLYRSSFIALCILLGLAGMRPTELLSWSALVLLVLMFIGFYAVKKQRHHFYFFIMFASMAFMSMCSDLYVRQKNDLLIIGTGRILLGISFLSACIEMIISKRILHIVGTPIEILVIGTGIAVILFVSSEKDINVAAVAAMSLVFYLILRACEDDDAGQTWSFIGVCMTLILFITLQLIYCGMPNPIPRLFSNIP